MASDVTDVAAFWVIMFVTSDMTDVAAFWVLTFVTSDSTDVAVFWVIMFVTSDMTDVAVLRVGISWFRKWRLLRVAEFVVDVITCWVLYHFPRKREECSAHKRASLVPTFLNCVVLRWHHNQKRIIHASKWKIHTSTNEHGNIRRQEHLRFQGINTFSAEGEFREHRAPGISTQHLHSSENSLQLTQWSPGT